MSELKDMPYYRGAWIKIIVGKALPRQIVAGGSVPLTKTCELEVNSWSPSMGSPAIFARGRDGKLVVFDYADVLNGTVRVEI